MSDNMTSDKQKLLRKIQMADFTCFETALYLDTHKTDRDALAFYNKYNKLSKELHEEYQKKYGPMHISESDSDSVWEWVEGPWPWEAAAN